MTRLIYKILMPEADAQMRADGQLAPSGVDAADGFIHFSTAAQLSQTLDKHYAGHDALIILAVRADILGDDLLWEVVVFPEAVPPTNSIGTSFWNPIQR